MQLSEQMLLKMTLYIFLRLLKLQITPYKLVLFTFVLSTLNTFDIVFYKRIYPCFSSCEAAHADV